MITLKSKREIALMRDASKVVAEVLQELRAHCKAGITTRGLDRLAEERTRALGGEPAFKGYRGYPRSLCASINEQVVHGIPGDCPLKEGDIVGLDYGVLRGGYYGDAAITVVIGSASPEVMKLVQITEECLARAVSQMVPDNHLADIGHAVQAHAESNGFSVVREFGGHGIGKHLHEDPMVLNYVADGRGMKLKAGLVLAVEPMVNMGTAQVRILSDQWTVVTTDGKPSAHFEHTVAITENGPDILTRSE